MRWVALLIALAGTQRDPKARYLQCRSDQMQYFWEQRLELADWARANGLYQEARGLLEYMARNIPGFHPLKSKAQTRLNGSWKRKPDEADEKKIADYQERLRTYYRETADLAFSAYREARRSGLEKEARQSLEETIEYYVDHEAARKERGEVKVEGFGWVPAADADLVRRNLVELDRLPEDDGKHGTWDDAWVVRSRHFLVRSDMPLSAIRNMIELVERLYGDVMSFVEGEFKEPPLPMGVYFFRRREDFDAVRGRLRISFEGISFFHGLTNIVYVRSFSSDRAAESGGVGRADVEVLLHECTHQILDMAHEGRVWSYYQSLGSRTSVAENFWVIEGIAAYFAARDRDARPSAAARGPELPKLAEFCGQGYEEFLRKGFENYAVASLLCRYLIERDRAKFVRFLKEYYRGNGTAAVFARTLGGTPEEIEKGFREWARKARSEGYLQAIARGVTFPTQAELDEARRKGGAAKAAVDIFIDRDVWARALQAVDERTGLFDGTLEVTVRFDALDGRHAEGEGAGGKGRIALDLRRLSEYGEKIEEYRAAVRDGKTYSVPPASLEGVLIHELAHCFQGEAGPSWYREGLAAYAAQDPHFVHVFRHGRQKPGDIEEAPKGKYLYARSWAFFEYFRERHGPEKFRRFVAGIAREGKTPSEAAREATGIDWAALKAEELRWSSDWLSRYR